MSPQATRKEKGNSAHLGDCRTLGDIYAPAPLARPPGSHGKTSVWLWVRGGIVLKDFCGSQGPGVPRLGAPQRAW